MNLEFELKKIVHDDGRIWSEPMLIFKDEKLNDTFLSSSISDNADDYLAPQFIDILDHYEDHLNELSSWSSGEGDWYAYLNKDGSITIADDDEDSQEEDLLPSITLPISEYKSLLLEYRKQAQEFRDNLPQMQEEGNKRRTKQDEIMKKKEVDLESRTIDDIKELIITDSSLTYRERKTIEAFLTRLETGSTFSESLNRMLINLQTIDDDNGKKNGLSHNLKIVFDKLVSQYGIDKKENKHIMVTSIGAGRRLSNKELVSYFICLIIFIFAIIIFCMYAYYRLKQK